MFDVLLLALNRTRTIEILAVVLIFLLGVLLGAVIMMFVFKGSKKNKNDSFDDRLIKEKVITAVKCGILDNLGVGIVAYDDSEQEPVYYNRYFNKFAGEKVPQNLDEFYKAYDNAEVESDRFNLLLKKRDSKRDGDEIRYTFVREDKIYEIKNLKVHHYDNGNIDDAGVKLFSKMIEDCNVFQIEDISNAPEHVKSQMDYSATLSHQLKTPITIILNTIEADSHIDRDSYDKIKRACQRVNETAKAFTKFSQENFHFQTTPVKNCIDGALERVEYYPGRDQVDITINYEQKGLKIFCDVECIITVIQNLITNAIKYIRYDGKTEQDKITINVKYDENSDGNAILIEVTDNGRGIPKDDLSHVFEGFFRVDRSGSQKDGGTGLGLTIVEKMTHRHLGKVQVVSSVNSGSCFMVTLPTAKKIITDSYNQAKNDNCSEKQIYKDASLVLTSQLNYALETIEVESGKEYKPESNIVTLAGKINDEIFNNAIHEYLDVDSSYEDFDDFDDFDDIGDGDDEGLYNDSDLRADLDEGDELIIKKEQDEDSIISTKAIEEISIVDEAQLKAEEEKQRNLQILREPVVQLAKRKQEIEAQKADEPVAENSELIEIKTLNIPIKEDIEAKTEEKIDEVQTEVQESDGELSEKRIKAQKESAMIHPDTQKRDIIKKKNFFKNQNQKN